MSDRVWMAPSKSRNQNSRYHDDEDCTYGPASPVSWSLSDAEDWDIKPCWRCAGGERKNTAHANSRELEQKLLALDLEDQ